MKRSWVFVFGMLLLATFASGQNNRATFSTGTVNNFSDNSGAGQARLTRVDNGISLVIQTSNLTPGHVYSVWWIVEATGGEIIRNATGIVAGGNGTAGLAAHLATGITPPVDNVSILEGGGVDFDNPRTALCFIVIHDHGPAVPDLIPRMMHTFTVGCSVASGGDGSGNNYDCVDWQYAVLAP